MTHFSHHATWGSCPEGTKCEGLDFHNTLLVAEYAEVHWSLACARVSMTNYQGEIPFSSDRKRMSVIVKHEGPQLSKEIRPRVESILKTLKMWVIKCVCVDGREFEFPFMGMRAEANTGVCVRGRTTLWGHALKSLEILIFCTVRQCVLHVLHSFLIWFCIPSKRSSSRRSDVNWCCTVAVPCFTVILPSQSRRCTRAQERSVGIGYAIHCFVSKSTRFVIGTSEGFSTKVC